MKPSTLAAVCSILKTDESVSVSDRACILALLRKANVGKPEAVPSSPARIVKRREAAARLGCGLRTVDYLNAHGLLRKVRLPGRTRAAGFRESDVVALIQA
jgi:hypothetical protein